MKQTIEIDVPEGKKAIWKDGKLIFEDIDLPNTWEEFCSITRREKPLYYINHVNSNIVHVIIDNLDPTKDRNLLPSEYSAKQHLALMQLHLLRDYYRQGWLLKEDEGYTIRLSYIAGLIVVGPSTYGFLSFQYREIAEKFLNNFRDLIEQAGDLVW